MDRYEFSLEATGTTWIVAWWVADKSKQDSQEIWESCVVLIQKFEKSYSRFDDKSFVQKLKMREGKLSVPKDFVNMLRIYRDLCDLSSGRITPLGGKMISDLGYDPEYSFEKKVTQDPVPMFEDSVRIVNNQQIIIKKGLSFDLGALGKGYLIDLVMEHILEHEGITRILINAGGDIAHYARNGQRARIALEHPDDPLKSIGVIEIGNESLASSGTSKRKWGEGDALHHIYDPQTSQSIAEIKATWIIHKRAAIADALATSTFLVDIEKLNGMYKFDYAIILQNRSIHSTQKFKEALFV